MLKWWSIIEILSYNYAFLVGTNSETDEDDRENIQARINNTDEVIHGVNCICKSFMGTCIANVKDPAGEETISMTEGVNY